MNSARRPIAVLFDLDGTLVDTVPFVLACVRHTFQGYGRGPTDAEWLAGMGTPLRTQLAALARSPGGRRAALRPLPGLLARAPRRDDGALPRGRPRWCAALRAAGHPLAVVTAKLASGAERTLRHVGLWEAFDVVVGADTVARCKPDPMPVRHALERMGRPAAEAVMIGDSAHDLVAGRGAGTATVGVLWGAVGREVLAPHADHLLAEDGGAPARSSRGSGSRPDAERARSSARLPPAMRIAYLGPPGTFSEEAVARCDLAGGEEPLPCPTFADGLRRGADRPGRRRAPAGGELAGGGGRHGPRPPGPPARAAWSGARCSCRCSSTSWRAPGRRLEAVDHGALPPAALRPVRRLPAQPAPGGAAQVATHSTADAARQVAEGPAGCGGHRLPRRRQPLRPRHHRRVDPGRRREHHPLPAPDRATTRRPPAATGPAWPSPSTATGRAASTRSWASWPRAASTSPGWRAGR